MVLFAILRAPHDAAYLVCSTPLLALRIGLYTASLVSLTDVLIGWHTSDCDAPTQLLLIQINTENNAPSPTWRASLKWRKQKAFPLPETVALWVLWKSREFPAFFRGRRQSYAHWHGTWYSLPPTALEQICRIITSYSVLFLSKAMAIKAQIFASVWWRNYVG